MIAEKKQTYPQAEYRQRERQVFEQSEYVESNIYPIAGSTKEYNRIITNLSGEFYIALLPA